jgi:hypothetical protein
MTVAQALGFGIVAGIVLFFVLQRLGWIDKLIDKLER